MLEPGHEISSKSVVSEYLVSPRGYMYNGEKTVGGKWTLNKYRVSKQ